MSVRVAVVSAVSRLTHRWFGHPVVCIGQPEGSALLVCVRCGERWPEPTPDESAYPDPHAVLEMRNILNSLGFYGVSDEASAQRIVHALAINGRAIRPTLIRTRHRATARLSHDELLGWPRCF